MELTYATIVAGKAKLLEDHLVTVGLQGGDGVGLLCQDESCLGRITFLRRVVVEELVVPDLFLGLPVDNVSLVHWSPEGDLAEVLAFRKVGRDICLPGSVTGDAVWDDGWLVDGVGCDEARFQSVRAIVDDQRTGWLGWWSGLGSSRRHGE